MNHPKGQNIEGLVLVEDSNRKYQFIISFVETSLVLSYLPYIVKFVWWRRVMRSFFFIIQKSLIARGLS